MRRRLPPAQRGAAELLVALLGSRKGRKCAGSLRTHQDFTYEG